MKPWRWQGERGVGDRNKEEKGYKKGIIIFLITRATPGTSASVCYISNLHLKKDIQSAF